MKRKLLLAAAIILVAGLILTGCPQEAKDSKLPPNKDPNLITEALILAATGYGGTTVTKTDDGYQVTGTVTAYSNWDSSVNDNRITLEIPADPQFSDAYFSLASRYIIDINFPDSAVKPIPEYTEGFRIYLENTVATQNTIQWDGTWAREWPDEYNACEGVGDMTIDRDLRLDPATSGSISNVGDYQHLVIVLGFDDADLGKTYTFTIKNVEVCGKSIIRPGLASLKDLFLKTVTPTSEPVGVTINSGTVKVKTIDIGEGVIRSQIYLTRTDTFTGPCYVSVNLPDDSALNVTQFRTYVSNTTDHSAPDGWVSDLQVDASAGGSLTGDVSTYWDGNLWSGSPSTTALTEVCIIITFADGTAENADYTFTINQIMVN